jgi:hypothetical protein
MRANRLFVVCFVALACAASTGCISFEEDVFLNQDNSGEFVLQLSMPDFPDSMTKSSPANAVEKTPQQQLADLRQQLTAGLPSSVALEQIKEIRENGSIGFCAIFKFKNVKDIEPALAALGKGNGKETGLADNSQWKMAIEKIGGKNLFTSSVYYEIQDDKEKQTKKTAEGAQSAGAAQPAKSPEKSNDMGSDLDQQLKPLLMGMVRMRFVLHTPSKITDSNADIVLRDNTAIWNSSMIAFLNSKKPIEMRATY